MLGLLVVVVVENVGKLSLWNVECALFIFPVFYRVAKVFNYWAFIRVTKSDN